MTRQQWVVHPNRSAIGPDAPGHNGHYRITSQGPPTAHTRYSVRVMLPARLEQTGDDDGTVTFRADSWRNLVAAASSFAEDFCPETLLPPFGFIDRGKWWWWDGTTTDHSILDGPDATAQVRRYLHGLFPAARSIELRDHSSSLPDKS
ncbi:MULTISPECIES: hypothetical protein [Mycobacteriaceae]|uniref:Uncharacterized protein n=1 Tax=Mycolicibacillus parakoreensis TaxID=1069221 RepID=A0ABY3U9M7_9MYCO|nr:MULTISPECIES: hypothetical protein [Mycobacteriaceae]MCV7316197.1 hypothetical protein [Mycolicibacillus parakoreensis]ULN54793.1 hypothetical protein MIU77_18870 [Mycolicibacillus parakoreensis]